MENKQSAEQTEHFGIGRTKWRITILVIFLFLAVLGSFLSLTKGSSIISIKEITDILLNPGNDPRSQIIWNIHRRCLGRHQPVAFRCNSASDYA